MSLSSPSQTTTVKITLSEKDWDIVTSALTDPPELNEALKTAIIRYKKQNLKQ
ncbi:MAG: DUF1778 domain-containing protein [Symploca sp. SIO1B1]|nr:DUF1778 domain-containing protein [Symploca sp. SIO2D2]NER99626.1 DUF1778 domain-containing protein [Symploca sp. SIO1B1]